MALAVAALVAAAAGAAEVGRYRLSCRADQTTFVLDTQSGRVWRYDRVDDAWYLYDLEALVGKRSRGRRSEPPEDTERETPEAEPPAR
jgi:hypothetical protein